VVGSSGEVIQMSINSTGAGNSGGPVFNKEGKSSAYSPMESAAAAPIPLEPSRSNTAAISYRLSTLNKEGAQPWRSLP